jgi:hypothetical protein
MGEPRELQKLVPFEVLAVAAIAVAPFGSTFPFAMPLFVVATASRWLRGRSWSERLVTPRAPRTAMVGALAGALAIAVATPLFGAFGVTAVDWWVLPALQGDGTQVALAVTVLLASAIALELALRGWIIERMLELSPGPATLPIATAALAEALVTPGPIVSRIGVGLFSAGLGVLYVACRRSALAPIAARCTFVIGAVLVERFAS